MKKLTFLFAMIFAVSMAVGQNTATTSQTGTDHDATVTQSGDLNSSTVTQDQGFNYDLERGSSATVDQIGNSNSSEVNSWGWNHNVKFYQEGDNNAAGVNQSGGENIADVYQLGNNNTVKGKGTSAKAFQKAGDPFGNDMVEFDVDQIGNDNTVSLWQEHSAYAKVYQEGMINNATINQTGPTGGSNNSAVVTITGNENMVDVSQVGDGNNVTTVVDYYGDASTVAEFNQIKIDQEGDNNWGILNNIKGASNTIDLIQTGNGNREYVQIFGSSNDVDITAEGNGNRGFWLLNGNATSNNLDVLMDGNGNYATGQIQGDNNTVNVNQTGNNNMVTATGQYNSKDGVVVIGDMNSADIMQLGDSNTGFIFQTGDNNIGSISSTGNGHFGSISQTGGMNEALITQN